MNDMSEQVVIVTGASQGIGEATARRFAEAGARVILSDTTPNVAHAAQAILDAYAYPASQTPWQAIQRALVGQLGDGAILEDAELFQCIDRTQGLPRDSH